MSSRASAASPVIPSERSESRHPERAQRVPSSRASGASRGICTDFVIPSERSESRDLHRLCHPERAERVEGSALQGVDSCRPTFENGGFWQMRRSSGCRSNGDCHDTGIWTLPQRVSRGAPSKTIGAGALDLDWMGIGLLPLVVAVAFASARSVSSVQTPPFLNSRRLPTPCSNPRGQRLLCRDASRGGAENCSRIRYRHRRTAPLHPRLQR